MIIVLFSIMLAVLAVLVVGLIGMLRRNDAAKQPSSTQRKQRMRQSNRWMVWRVALQAIAVLVFAIAYLASNHWSMQ